MEYIGKKPDTYFIDNTYDSILLNLYRLLIPSLVLTQGHTGGVAHALGVAEAWGYDTLNDTTLRKIKNFLNLEKYSNGYNVYSMYTSAYAKEYNPIFLPLGAR